MRHPVKLGQGTVLAAMVTAAMGLGGCMRTFEGRVVQPNPLLQADSAQHQSEKITIVTGDMDLRLPHNAEGSGRASPVRTERYPLRNEASFTMVSRDRLRFHVQLEHKWKEWASVGNWSVKLVDSAGHTYKPESVEHAKTKLLVTMWDVEQQTAQRNRYGDIVALNDDGWKRRQPLGSLAVFRGKADFVFYKRDLFTRDLSWVKLVVQRDDVTFEFEWDFHDQQVADR